MKAMALQDIGLAVVTVAVVAAGLGYWLFGPLGVALWVPLAVFATVTLHFLGRASPGLALAVPLLLAAALLHDSSTLTWGGADAPDGTRYKISPIGITQVLSPNQTVSPTVKCRWYFAGGDADMCAMAPGATLAYRQLLAIFPVICLGIVICLVGCLGQCRQSWRRRFPNRVVACTAAVPPAIALWLFSHSPSSALAVLTDLESGVSGTLGTMEVTAAILLCLAAAMTTPACEWLSNKQMHRSRRSGRFGMEIHLAAAR
ncbi:MAG: hypothetical protein ACREBD_06795 [Blastocatellia bacterium]